MLMTFLFGLGLSLAAYQHLHSVPLAAPQSSGHAQSQSNFGETGLPEPAPGKGRSIRVCLTANPVSSVELAISTTCTIRVGDKSISLPRLAETRVRCEGAIIRLGSREFRGTRIEITPEKSPAIWVNDHQYRGTIRLHRQPGGKLLAVNVLPMEDYIASVVDSEMPAAFPVAARRAQAICARTYAVYQIQQNRSHPYWDLFASTRSQKYLGYQYRSGNRRLAGETQAGRQIATNTAGMVCTHDGKVFCTYYSAVCGGQTTQGDLVFRDAAPPLKPVTCNYCKEAKLYRWTKKHTRKTTTGKLASLLGKSTKPLLDIHRTDNDPLTPASEFRLSNGQQSARVSAAELRRRFSLPSATFQVWEDENHFHFQGRGHGHGVGLCQWGARGLAQTGKSAGEILQHYYPGSRVVTRSK